MFASLKSIISTLTTYNPFDICDQKNIIVIFKPLGAVKGLYCLIRKRQFIIISSDLNFYEKRLVCAHELGHAIFHPEINLYYTSFPIGRYEREANDFAVNLLLAGAAQEYPYYDLYELACIAGIPTNLLELAREHIVITLPALTD